MPDLITQLGEQRRKVDFDSYDITVQQLIQMVETRAIDIAPAYQRQYRWDEHRQSQFIESIFLGIPIPSLFMAANADGTWELVDGVQRLSTIIHFGGTKEARQVIGLDTILRLSGLEKLSAFNHTFDELPQSVQLQFKLRPIKVTTLSDKSDSVVRFDLFERLNTGGIALTHQEIRACIFRGPFNELLERLGKDTNFCKVVRLPTARNRDGTREEFVLRFFAFLDSYKQFEHSVVGFLNTYMKFSSVAFDYPSNERLFQAVFKELSKLFPDGLYRRQRVTPVNLFEAVAVGAALAYRKHGRLRSTRVREWVDSEELKSYTTGATNDRSKVIGRIEYCMRQFGG